MLRDGLGGLSGLAGASRTSMAIGARGQAAMVRGALVSANYFEVLGVAVPLGRGFTPDEERPANAAVAVIGHGMWQRMFAGDPSALGDFITVGGHAVRIVGVASSTFGVPARWGMQPIEVWLPWGFAPTIGADRPSTGLRAGLVFDIDAIGRIDSSASLELVQAQAPAAAARVAATRADGTHTHRTRRDPVRRENLPGAALDIAGTLLVPVIVLAIACINAANLLLVRGQQRTRDIAVRLAIGASRGRIAREVLIESLLLALLSGGVAVAIGVVSIRAVESLVPLPLRIDGFDDRSHVRHGNRERHRVRRRSSAAVRREPRRALRWRRGRARRHGRGRGKSSSGRKWRCRSRSSPSARKRPAPSPLCPGSPAPTIRPVS